ncbi:MAG: glycosyltransferase 87 family protein [Chloroflexota bacterium]
MSDAAAPAAPARIRRRWLRPIATNDLAQYSGAVALGGALVALTVRFGQMRGAETDLFPRWYALRQLLLRGRDPYGADVTGEIAAQLALSGAPEQVQAAYGFVYPLPGALLLAPLAMLPYEVAVGVWVAMWLVGLPVVTVAAGRVLAGSDRLARRDTGRREVLLATVLALTFLPSMWNVALAQPGLLAFGLLAGAVWLTRRRPAMAGAALAAGTLLKPHLVGLVAVAWLVYCLARSNVQKSRRFVAGFLVCAGALAGAATALLPAWPVGLATALTDYGAVSAMRPLAPAVVVGASLILGWAGLAAAALALVVAGGLAVWTVRAWIAARRSHVWLPVEALSRTVVFGALIVPPAWETNAIVLLLPIAGVLAALNERGARTGAVFVVVSAVLSAVLAPLPLVLPWRSGTMVVLVYVALWSIARWWLRPAANRGSSRSGAAADAA